MKASHTSILRNRQPAETFVFVALLILALSLTMALGQEAPAGYLARGLGGFSLSEAPPPKRPTKPLPPAVRLAVDRRPTWDPGSAPKRGSTGAPRIPCPRAGLAILVRTTAPLPCSEFIELSIKP